MLSSSKIGIYVGTLSLALFHASLAPAQSNDLEISVSPTPIGSGARAAGMADAFVAIADDATAASWNPAGLVQLEEPELSIVGAWNRLTDDFNAASFHPEVDGLHDVQNLELNYLSFVYPLPIVPFDRNVTVSLNYQRKYDFTRKFTLDHNRHTRFNAPGGAIVHSFFQKLEYEQSGGLAALSPAMAFELTHRLSLGLAVNFWRTTPFNDNSWTQESRDTQVNFLAGGYGIGTTTTREVYRDFSGENFTLGLMWDINDRWKIGVRYDTAFTGETDYERRGRRLVYPNFSSLLRPFNTREKRRIRFPDSLAVGVAYRHNDRLTLSLDVTRTDWHDFYVKDSEGVRRSLVDGTNIDDRRARTDLDPTTTVRFGAEYIFVPRQPTERLNRLWTVRGGLFYDEEPATGKKNRLAGERGDGEPDAFYGFALGVGVQLYQRVNIDAAYQYRFGNGVNRDFVRGVRGFEEDVGQHRFLLSTVVYF